MKAGLVQLEQKSSFGVAWQAEQPFAGSDLQSALVTTHCTRSGRGATSSAAAAWSVAHRAHAANSSSAAPALQQTSWAMERQRAVSAGLPPCRRLLQLTLPSALIVAAGLMQLAHANSFGAA